MYDLVRTSGVQPKILSKQQLTNTIRTIENELRCLLLAMMLVLQLLVGSIVTQLPCILFFTISAIRLHTLGVVLFSGALFEHRLHSGVTSLHLVHFQKDDRTLRASLDLINYL